jgi:hypothetical protein
MPEEFVTNSSGVVDGARDNAGSGSMLPHRNSDS